LFYINPSRRPPRGLPGPRPGPDGVRDPPDAPRSLGPSALESVLYYVVVHCWEFVF